jgi:hypothetical protein
MGLALRVVEAVEVEQAPPLTLIDAGGQRPAYSSARTVRGALFLGFILAALQILDGIVTSIGISRFGVAMEGNPLLRTLMTEFGHIPALAFVKLLALFVVVFLTVNARRMPWVRNALGIVTLIYIFAAILPWIYILFIDPIA